MQAELVYIHFLGNHEEVVRRLHLLDMHLIGLLPGLSFPPEYTIHFTEVDSREGSLNLHVTNGGGPIHVDRIEATLNGTKLFSGAIVGKFGFKEIKSA